MISNPPSTGLQVHDASKNVRELPEHRPTRRSPARWRSPTRVVTNVEPNHWRFVGDDGLVLVNVPETLIDPVGLQKFGGRSAEHVALVGGAKDKLFEVEVVFEICDNRHSKTIKKSPTDK